jgi:hypothetical protein
MTNIRDLIFEAFRDFILPSYFTLKNKCKSHFIVLTCKIVVGILNTLISVFRGKPASYITTVIV